MADPWWLDLPTEELLQVRICDLGLSIGDTALEARVDRLHDEMRRAGLRFRPYVWLSTDWFTPERHTGFAIPFFLAHPRLVRLEHQIMMEVEGGTTRSCMQLLRHEAAHALDNAYRLHRRKSWRETFGSYAAPYPDFYTVNPRSREYVHHLDGFYAQSHPAEDWAETFAVWLAPGQRWRTRYENWGALAKLEAVDRLVQTIATQSPPVRTRARPESLARQRQTLSEYYRQRKQLYGGPDQAWVYDRYLRRVFPEDGRRRYEPATKFLRRHATELRRRVSHFTEQPRYVVDQALRAISARVRSKSLRRTLSKRDTLTNAAILLTTLTISLERNSRQRYQR